MAFPCRYPARRVPRPCSVPPGRAGAVLAGVPSYCPKALCIADGLCRLLLYRSSAWDKVEGCPAEVSLLRQPENQPISHPSSPISSLGGGVGVSSAKVGDSPLGCHYPEEKLCQLFSVNPTSQYVSSFGTSPVSTCLPSMAVEQNSLCECCWSLLKNLYCTFHLPFF